MTNERRCGSGASIHAAPPPPCLQVDIVATCACWCLHVPRVPPCAACLIYAASLLWAASSKMHHVPSLLPSALLVFLSLTPDSPLVLLHLVVSPLARRHAFFLFHAHLDDRDLFVFVCVCSDAFSQRVCGVGGSVAISRAGN